jgi:FtsZ-binding cell division protein ZapB
LKSEAELQELRASGGVLAGPELNLSRQRVIELEMENQALRQRIDGAKDRLKALAGRLSFLEQQGGGNAA